uniref:hypothetical protein n=1 Tax=Mycobacterium tilburgii TaxID=44467 RepID=UPI0038991F2C
MFVAPMIVLISEGLSSKEFSRVAAIGSGGGFGSGMISQMATALTTTTAAAMVGHELRFGFCGCPGAHGAWPTG